MASTFRKKVALYFVLATAIALPHNLEARQSYADCVSGVHIIAARGTGDPQGVGNLGPLAATIMAQIPDSNLNPLVYPASLLPTYWDSEQKGRDHLVRYITHYARSCPDTRIVLLGYSQGAQVVADTLCGTTDGDRMVDTSPLDFEYGKNVKAVVIFGDPSHHPGLPWDAGTSVRDGIFPRRNNSACDPYEGLFVSYCDTGDQFCDSGNDLGVHGTYLSRYGDDAAAFAVARVTS